MKQIWLLSIFILWLSNLFFIGMMIGQSFPKQNSFQNDLTIYDKNRSVIEKAQIFTIQLTGASKQVLNRLDDKWRYVIGYAVDPSKIGLILETVIANKKDLAGEKIAKDLRILDPEYEFNNKTPVSHLEVNLPILIDNYIGDQPKKDTSGRPDPFMDIITPIMFKTSIPTLKNLPDNKNRNEKNVTNDKKKQDAPIDTLVKTNPLNKFHLRGIVIGEINSAYIEDQNGYQKVTIGDSIAGGRVIDITKQSVVVQVEDQLITLTAEGSK